MPEIRRFYVKNGKKNLALIEYDTCTKQFLRMRLNPKLDVVKAPAMIKIIARAGLQEIGGKDTLDWVRERIIPANRMNISEILRAARIPEYDELAMLLWAHGRCVQDNMYVEELQADEVAEF